MSGKVGSRKGEARRRRPPSTTGAAVSREEANDAVLRMLSDLDYDPLRDMSPTLAVGEAIRASVEDPWISDILADLLIDDDADDEPLAAGRRVEVYLARAERYLRDTAGIVALARAETLSGVMAQARAVHGYLRNLARATGAVDAALVEAARGMAHDLMSRLPASLDLEPPLPAPQRRNGAARTMAKASGDGAEALSRTRREVAARSVLVERCRSAWTMGMLLGRDVDRLAGPPG